MPDNESLVNAINETWIRGIVPRPIPRDDITEFTRQCAGRLFRPGESALTIAEDHNGLTVVSRQEPAYESDTRTILAAQLSADENTLALELHDERQPAHFTKMPGHVYGAKNCRLLELDLANGGVKAFFPFLNSSREIKEIPTPARQPFATLYRALGAKALMNLIESEPTDDVLRSPYARRKTMETHCAGDPLVQHPADAFLKPSIQQAIRNYSGPQPAHSVK